MRVATPEDPASARLGESFWAFLPRTVIGSLRSAWELERERLRRARAARSVDAAQRHPQRVGDDASCCSRALAAVFGVGRAALPADPGGVRLLLLEVVNYLEHYGLLRQKREDGRYERTRPEHSWNSNNVASNVLLYHLQRHSDHHANPMRRYQALRHFDEAPQLPTGYAGMIVLALRPAAVAAGDGPPRARALRRRRRRCANLQPRKRRAARRRRRADRSRGGS